MGYVGVNSAKSCPETNVPPDVDHPPFYIPVRSIADRFALLQELGNGSFGSVTLAKKTAGSECRHCETNALHENQAEFQHTRCALHPQYRNTLMEESKIPNVEEENFRNKQRGVLAIKTMMTRLPTLNDYTRVREIKFILSMPAHKNLVHIFELFIDDANYQLHIVMECMEQNLYQLMRARRKRIFSLPSLKSILTQLLAGIRHIHEHDFFHRDLKPENILISPANHYYSKKWILDGHYPDNYVVKIADYGLARHVANKSPYTAYVSTRWYRSPEILLRKGSYSRPLDIWAFGCVVVEVATFRPLFPGSDEMDQIWKILEVLGTPHNMPENSLTGYKPHGGFWEKARQLASRIRLKFPYVEGVKVEAIIDNPHLQLLCDVVKACLVWDPKKRATVSELCRMPYFENTEVAIDARSWNDENSDQVVENGWQRDWESKVSRVKSYSDPQNSEISSLAPNIIDFNGGNTNNSKEAHLSISQFLKESADSGPETDSAVSSSICHEDKIGDHENLLSGDLAGMPLSEVLESDLPLSDSLPGESGRVESNSTGGNDSFADYYATKSTDYEGPNLGAPTDDLGPNYIHYEDVIDQQLHPRCNVLRDMSIVSDSSDHVPRSFAVPRITETSDTSLQEHDSTNFSHANSLTF
ncbi:LADA_0C10132g1_1 [Lachancea dasiensis]|uniref:LADA_0C10132g1_1 n=1 Tax=Lachancea dasiensis TaxID=1072105 RepID=A0A1G4J0V8_9SACH|nr:LADA_0C10132g1_1 [Lachancea dasiensis]